MIDRMIEGDAIRVEGYIMFKGIMRVIPRTEKEPFDVNGEWLYRPDTDCWYCGGASYPASVCFPFKSEICIKGEHYAE